MPAKFLIEPAPNKDQLEQILQSAMSVPDHNSLQPFRFITISGDARFELAKIFESAVRQRNPQAGEDYFKKQHDKPLRSPLIVVVVCCLQDNPKVPKIEQQLSAGCAAQNIMHACHALDFGACWLTGDNAYDESVKEALGLTFDEQITGFIYMGSKEKQEEVIRKQATEITSDWTESQQWDTAI